MTPRPAAPLKLGMVGGGEGAFIGAVHRIASRIDGEFTLVAGALSSSPERARASGAALGLDPARVYADFTAMADAEAARADGIDAVAIVTPNHVHLAPALAFLERGINVICDKPLTGSLDEARTLAAAAEASDALFVLTHNYSGYAMVRQARAMVAAGALGTVRVVNVEYPQGWLAAPVEAEGNQQAAWRTDPAKSGAGGAIGDIGTHALQLATFVTGEAPARIAADLTAFVPGRRLDDNAHVMLRYASGAKGLIWASQVAVGCENALRLRVYGDAGGLEWCQETPDVLMFTPHGEPTRRLTRGGPGTEATAALNRIPAGHPEGYLEGFANIYRDAARAIRARKAGVPVPEDLLLPTVRDGLLGVTFVDACVRSSAADAAWIAL